jgi:hypothetical protein
MRLSARHGALLVALVLPMAVPCAATAATWSASSLTNPPNVNSAELFGVSCSSASECEAPGHGFYTSTGTVGAVAQKWNGSSWAPVTGVEPNHGQKNGILWGVHCPVETMCMNVGSYGTSGGQVAWSQRDVSGFWTTWNIGVPGGATRSELKDVWCTTESNWCMASGWKLVSGESKAWVARWNTVEWVNASAVEKLNSALNGISCVSTSYCVAVGQFVQAANLQFQPLAEVWNGSSWSVYAPPVPGSWETAVLNSVQCVPGPTTWCMASGSLKRNEAGTSYWRPFADIWNGSSWTTTTGVPWGANNEALAYGSSCRSTTECWIVGEGHTGSTLHPWAVKWTGSTWENQSSIKLAPGAEGAQLRDISCYASSSCKAVGWSLFGGTKEPLAETVTP